MNAHVAVLLTQLDLVLSDRPVNGNVINVLRHDEFLPEIFEGRMKGNPT